MIALELHKIIAAPQATVFAAWTDAAIVRRWLAPGDMAVAEADVDARQGGKYRIAMRAGDQTSVVLGEYQEVTPVERLVFTWSWQGDPADPTLVTVTFATVAKGTEVRVRHERFETETARQLHESGWTGCLTKLGEALVGAG